MIKLNTELLFRWLSRFLVMMTCLPIHEAAHAWAADRMGDPTPRAAGRLSLNPFRHLDLLGSVLLITMGFGWAKPVPVNSSRFKRPKLGMAITAAAGPLSNILLATLLLAIMKVLFFAFYADVLANTLPTWISIAGTILDAMIYVNLSLAVFNLLPMPPLDGSKLFGALLPDRLYYGMMRYERYVMLLVLALSYANVLSKPISFLVGGLSRAIDFLTLPVEHLMRGLILG